VEEQQKYEIFFVATLLCARKLIESIESDKPNLARQHWMDRAIEEATFVMERTNQWSPNT